MRGLELLAEQMKQSDTFGSTLPDIPSSFLYSQQQRQSNPSSSSSSSNTLSSLHSPLDLNSPSPLDESVLSSNASFKDNVTPNINENNRSFLANSTDPDEIQALRLKLQGMLMFHVFFDTN